MRTVAIIGGGPAGMTAAGAAAEAGCRVLLFEKNDKLGKKMRITGKGRCNITNAAGPEEMLGCIPTNPKFLYSALYTFTSDDIVSIMKRGGTETKTERGGRIFPVSDNAHDAADALKKYALAKTTDWIRAEAVDIAVKDGAAAGVKTKDRIYNADAVIIATGGVSYPLTGSTGDGYRFAERLGHTVIPPKPSLIPIVTKERWAAELMGLSLKNIRISAYNSCKKRVFEDFGEMLFTHFGISGPVVLSMSAHLKNIERESYTIKIDLKPALSEEQLDKRILRDFEGKENKHIINSLDALLPKALIPRVIALAGLEEHCAVNSVTREQRRRLVSVLKGLELSVQGFRPVEEAIVTSGGVKVSEINPSTMESKLIKGLYFAGEVIDVDAYTGGYNLQIAYSTGYLAGISAAEC